MRPRGARARESRDRRRTAAGCGCAGTEGASRSPSSRRSPTRQSRPASTATPELGPGMPSKVEERLGAGPEDDRQGQQEREPRRVGRSNRRSFPVAIVNPERDSPASSPAAACATPIQRPSAASRSARSRSGAARRAATPSAKKNQAQATSMQPPIRPSDRKRLEPLQQKEAGQDAGNRARRRAAGGARAPVGSRAGSSSGPRRAPPPAIATSSRRVDTIRAATVPRCRTMSNGQGRPRRSESP